MPQQAAANQRRVHIVFVPGFGGFDALGQVEYYVGTTAVFHRWCRRPEARTVVDLHYFDNLPTAGVRTRAKRLRQFLTKRVLRGEFQSGDHIALVGHSTGGLDIRQLLLDLGERQSARLHVEGVEDHEQAGPEPVVEDHSAGSLATEHEAGRPPTAVEGQDLLSMISHVVFLSVPQRGTNIANWVRAQPLGRRILVSIARMSFDALDVLGIEQASVAAAKIVASLRELAFAKRLGERIPDLVAALADANAEVGLRTSTNPFDAAAGREALADLNLWLSHTHGDFLAINDLACTEADPSPWRSLANVVGKVTRPWARQGADNDASDLARADDAARAKEQTLWSTHDIAVRSYATVARDPWPQERANGAGLRSKAEVVRRALRSGGGSTDITFRGVYAACSAGPFVNAMREDAATCFASRTVRKLAASENDGIVNTASMLWPNGRDTLLVEGDHGDIIGHFGRREVVEPGENGRKFDSYDIFESASGFGESTFEDVWFDVFSFIAP